MGAAFRMAALAAWLAWALAGPAMAQGFEGELDSTSPESGGYRYFAFAFDVTGDAPVQVTLRSADFDAYLILVAPGGSVSQNDDFSGRDAGIRIDTPEPGRWTAIATTYQAGATGRFTLSAESLRADPLEMTEADDAIALLGLEGRSTNSGVEAVIASMSGDDWSYAEGLSAGAEEMAGMLPTAQATVMPAPGTPVTAGLRPRPRALAVTPAPVTAPSPAWAAAALPWPPPLASSSAVFRRDRLLREHADLATLGDLDRVLTEALNAAGYYGSRYLSAPGGFAVVTQLERIDADGDPVAEDRWTPEDAAASGGWTLTNYLRALVSAPVGYFRVIAVVVSDQPFASAPEPATVEWLRAWSGIGLNTLPADVRDQAYADADAVTVLVYEFEKTGADPQIVLPGRHSAPQHLRHTTLAAYFN